MNIEKFVFCPDKLSGGTSGLERIRHHKNQQRCPCDSNNDVKLQRLQKKELISEDSFAFVDEEGERREGAPFHSGVKPRFSGEISLSVKQQISRAKASLQQRRKQITGAVAAWQTQSWITGKSET